MPRSKLFPVMLLRIVLVCIFICISGVLGGQQELEYVPTVRSKNPHPQYDQRHTSIKKSYLRRENLLKVYPDGVYLTAPVSAHVRLQTRHTLTSRDIHWA